MALHLALWPPPWKRDSRVRWAASILWPVIVAPVFVAAFVVAVPVGIFTRLTGWGATVNRSREEVATYIDNFINARGGQWDWDDFISIRIVDPMLDEIRKRCNATHEEFPPGKSGGWCSPAGTAELQRILDALKEPQSR